MFENYPQYEGPLAQLQLVLFMLGMGATLSVRDFTAIARSPRYLIAGIICQFGLTPLLALLVNTLFFDAAHDAEQAGLAVGLILVAAMPGGTLSKVFAYLGRGNIALSTSLTAAGTLATVVTVPLLLRLLAAGYVPDDFAVPVHLVVRDVALFLLLPVAAGMLVAREAPRYRLAFSRWCIRLGFVVVLLVIVGSLGSGRINPAEYGWRAPLAIITFCLLAQQTSLLPFRLLGWPRADCLSVGIEVTMRNLNLALLLKAQLFPAAAKGIDAIADGVLFVILYYAGVAVGCGTPLALRFRLKARRERAQLPSNPEAASSRLPG